MIKDILNLRNTYKENALAKSPDSGREKNLSAAKFYLPFLKKY